MTEQCLPISVHEAQAIGLIDDVILHDDLGDSRFGRFRDQITRIAEKLSRSPRYGTWLARKQATREQDERLKPLQRYRLDELQEMKKNFWGEDRSYHLARAAFVRKQPRGHRYYVPVSARRYDEAVSVKGRSPHRVDIDHSDCNERLYGT